MRRLYILYSPEILPYLSYRRLRITGRFCIVITEGFSNILGHGRAYFLIVVHNFALSTLLVPCNNACEYKYGIISIFRTVCHSYLVIKTHDIGVNFESCRCLKIHKTS